LLQVDNAQLQEDAQLKSSQLDQAVKIAATARQEADSLRKELGQPKKKLKEKEKEKVEAQSQKKEKEDLLHKSTAALLGNFTAMSSNSFSFNFIGFLLLLLLLAEAADIPADSIGKLPADSATDAISMEIESGDLVRDLLQKNKAV
jgi:hypothetical protein